MSDEKLCVLVNLYTYFTSDGRSESAGESGPQMGRSVEKQVRWFWRLIMMPVLFGLVGASVNFASIERGIIPKSCAIIIAGACPMHPQCLPGSTCLSAGAV